jgi:acetate kinase
MAAGDGIEVGGYSWTLAHQADKFFICVPNLVSGQSYTVNKNGVAFATGNATTEIEGMMMGGNGGGGGMKPPGGGGGRR